MRRRGCLPCVWLWGDACRHSAKGCREGQARPKGCEEQREDGVWSVVFGGEQVALDGEGRDETGDLGIDARAALDGGGEVELVRAPGVFPVRLQWWGGSDQLCEQERGDGDAGRLPPLSQLSTWGSTVSASSTWSGPRRYRGRPRSGIRFCSRDVLVR